MNIKNYVVRWGYAALTVAVAVAASACTKTQELPGGGPDESAIGFNIGMLETRAAQTITSSLNRIGVFGYSTPMTGWDDGQGDTYESDYFLNKMVTRTAPGVWWYDGPTKYWPEENKGLLTFFAYAPFIDVHNIYTLHPTAGSPTGSPTITYTPPADAIHQVDLLWDKKVDLHKSSYNGAVRFDMKHALTSIDFEVRVKDDDKDAPYTIEVLNVKVGNAVASGVFDLYDGEWTLDPVGSASQLTSYSLTPAENKGLNDVTFHCQYNAVTTPGYADPFSGYVPLNKPYGTMMLLPQEFRDGTETALLDYPTTISITYRTTNLLTGDEDEITQTIELASHPVASGNKWEKGNGITYQFTISLFEGVAVKVKVGAFIQADKWQPDDEANIDVG